MVTTAPASCWTNGELDIVTEGSGTPAAGGDAGAWTDPDPQAATASTTGIPIAASLIRHRVSVDANRIQKTFQLSPPAVDCGAHMSASSDQMDQRRERRSHRAHHQSLHHAAARSREVMFQADAVMTLSSNVAAAPTNTVFVRPPQARHRRSVASSSRGWMYEVRESGVATRRMCAPPSLLSGAATLALVGALVADATHGARHPTHSIVLGLVALVVASLRRLGRRAMA